jgi:hypothetical protein
MEKRISQILDHLSDFLATRKGLIPMIGIVLIIINFFLQFFPGGGVIVDTNLLFHIGVVLAVIGLLLSRAL